MRRPTWKTTLLAATAVVAVLGLAHQPARACGACAEDKVAATYDHALVEQARAQHKLVAFFDVQVPTDLAALKEAAAALPGVEPGSVRTSAEPAALSLLVDPKVTPPGAIAELLMRQLRGRTALLLLRTLPGAAR